MDTVITIVNSSILLLGAIVTIQRHGYTYLRCK